ncbi:MAG: fluoride efflux transporter CrcB [Rhodospirillaceae bacterium]|jgi:CrcB protein|nr:fluoride efflux transporter CrcB [Rhodospirillaceae bacterium]MBT5665025.1 fluoride efflux transporter CrcB [Rhodospirillaceae bacterium]MBT5808913.1 fluoride efflux transporter CrcB [Rhodospirillaceae bacterium]
MNMILAIAAGGAVGAVARHFAAAQIGHWLGHGFPWGIMIVNIVGSLCMGVLVETLALTWSPSQEVRAFLVVGVLGAFTTFSTFSLDVALLYERGQIMAAALYVAGSVTISVLALFAGLALMRSLLT